MPRRRLTLLCLLGTLVGSFCGCAARKAAQQSARTIQHSVDLYQQRVDLLITRQNDYYETRLAEYQNAREQLFTTGIDEQRDSQSAQFGAELASNPTKTRIPALVDFLKGQEEREYALRAGILDQQHEAAEKFNAAIAQLRQQRQVLENVKADLSKLSKKSKLQDQIGGLKDYGEQVAADLKKAGSTGLGSKK